jgi:hypothetical protein
MQVKAYLEALGQVSRALVLVLLGVLLLGVLFLVVLLLVVLGGLLALVASATLLVRLGLLALLARARLVSRAGLGASAGSKGLGESGVSGLGADAHGLGLGAARRLLDGLGLDLEVRLLDSLGLDLGVRLLDDLGVWLLDDLGVRLLDDLGLNLGLDLGVRLFDGLGLDLVGAGGRGAGGLDFSADALVRLAGGLGLGVGGRRDAGGLDLGADARRGGLGLGDDGGRLLGLGVVLVFHLGLVGRAVPGLRDDLEVDLDASILALDRLGIEVPAAVVTGGAGVEGGRLAVGEVVVLDGEASIGFGAFVALLLRGGRGQDAAAVLVVVDVWDEVSVNALKRVGKMWERTAGGVDRVLGLLDGKVGLVDAVLSIDELADHATGARGRGTIGGKRELAVLGQHDVLSGEECGVWLTRGAGWAWPWPEPRRPPWRACCSSTSWSRCGCRRGEVWCGKLVGGRLEGGR